MKFKGVQWEGVWHGHGGFVARPHELDNLSYLIWGDIPTSTALCPDSTLRDKGYTLWPYLRDFPNESYHPMMYREQ